MNHNQIRSKWFWRIAIIGLCILFLLFIILGHPFKSKTSVINTLETIDPQFQSTLIPAEATVDQTKQLEGMKSLHFLPESDNDGQIKITIINTSDACVQPGDQITIKYSIENISEASLAIPIELLIANNKFSISSNVIPLFYTSNYEIIWTPQDSVEVGFEAIPQSVKDHTLNNDEIFKDLIEIIIPEEISDDRSTINITPSPGRYYLKIVYQNFLKQDGLWTGVISSNLFEICVE